MRSKCIVMLVLTAAVIMQTRAAEEDDGKDKFGDGITTPEILPKPEAEVNGGVPSDADEGETSVNDEPNSEQTDTTSATSNSNSVLPVAPEDSYFVRGDDDMICLAIKLKAKLEFIISAEESKEKTITVDLREKSPSFGDCGEYNLEPRLTIEVTEDINITFAVQKADDGVSWIMSSMELQFNAAYLFDKDDEPTLQILTAKEMSAFTAPMEWSFSCDDPTKVTMYNKEDTLAAYIVISSIKMQAFDVLEVFGPERVCYANAASASKRVEERKDGAPISHGTDAVPIAIVLALAILALFGITGFAIHRMTHQKDVDYYPELYNASNKL